MPQSKRSQPVIGMLTSQLNRGFHRAALLSVFDAARAAGAKLVCFDGGVLASPGDAAASIPNELYGLVSPEAVDGLIVWSSALDWNAGAEPMEQFCWRFAPLPVVSVGRAFPGIPSILVDNYQGMRAAAEHLICQHGLRGCAFLRGPEGALEAELRFRAYCDVLAECALPFRPELVSEPTNWIREDGPAAIADLLDRRGLRPGIDFDAILSVGDDMACGAMEALRSRGVRIPNDVAVVGFNDDDEGRAILPALTTVRQPVEAMGRAAVGALMALLAEQPAAEVITLPLDLVVRRSCGCLSPAVMQAASRAAGEEGRPDDMLAVAHEAADLARSNPATLVELLTRFDEDLEGRQGGFLPAFNELLQDAALAGEDVWRWQAGLSVIRRQVLPRVPAARLALAEDLWQQARVLVGETAGQARAYQRFRAGQDTQRLGDFSRLIQTASSQAALFATVTEELPELDVRACYLCLYEDSALASQGNAYLLFGFDEHGVLEVPPEARRFRAVDLLPGGILMTESQALTALPLYFGLRHLGYLLLDMGQRGLAFGEMLREQISGALEGLFLREELRRALQQAEEANRLKSRFLSTVSHELRTPLSLIVGTIEMMQREAEEAFPGLAAAQSLPPAVLTALDSFERDLTSIHMGARHLSHLIGDVLDLASSQAGELRLACEPLRLAEVLARVAVLGEPLARERGLEWRADIPDPCPLVWGDRTRLQQVALNLVSNAVKFTSAGSVSLWVEVGRHEVLVAVSDTGMGIPLAEQELIFDEFRQSERAARRGLGGMGLGLAISKRLIDLHGGRMGVISTGSDGAGSTIYFTLPILTGRAGLSGSARDRSGVVLVLTERPGHAGPLLDHLRGKGFLVEVVPLSPDDDWLGGVVASRPGAVVLDLEPAAERGWELMRVLKLSPETADIPVLFYSLSDTAGSVLSLDYLAKPLGGELLAAAMARQGLARDDAARTVLVVDDDPDILSLHLRIVAASLPRCRITTASNGREALTAMAQTRPDLVLLDLMMPELDGFGVLEVMRDDPALRSVPVIVLTAQILSLPDMARLQRGVAAVLAKELFSEAEVLAQIEAALLHGGKRLGSEAQRVARMAMAYIHEHYAEPIAREDIARAVAVNERYLTRCFGQEMGVTPMVYLNRYRIKQARAMLERTPASVTEVALACGFSDSSYFGRVFQREVGISPGAYRRNVTYPPPAPS